MSSSSSLTWARAMIRNDLFTIGVISVIAILSTSFHTNQVWAFSQKGSFSLTRKSYNNFPDFGHTCTHTHNSIGHMSPKSQLYYQRNRHGEIEQGTENKLMKVGTPKSNATDIKKTLQSLVISVSILLATTLFQPHFSTAAESNSNNNSNSNIESIEAKVLSSSQKIEQTSSVTSSSNKNRYWSLVNSEDKEEVMKANEKLMDYAVGTINTMYYDNSGGVFFSPKDLYDRWRVLRVYGKEGINGVKDLISYSDVKKVSPDSQRSKDNVKDDTNNNDREKFEPQLFLIDGDKVKVQMNHWRQGIEADGNNNGISTLPANAFDSRENVVDSLKWLVSTLDDPYSKYLTREELQNELNVRDDGFLGLGFIVEGPQERPISKISSRSDVTIIASTAASTTKTSNKVSSKGGSDSNSNPLLTSSRVSNLPMVTAIAPNSPAERAGIVVGDRIVAVAGDDFIGLKIDDMKKKFNTYTGAENYFGIPELTIAKPVYRASSLDLDDEESSTGRGSDRNAGMRKDEVMGYKLSRVRLTTISLQASLKTNSEKAQSSSTMPEIIPSASAASPITKGGDSIVQWELLKPNDSIFRKYLFADEGEFRSTDRVGYIRLTRFSRSSTAGYIKAVEELEKAGAQSYIIDVRNNYGGVIQESMLTAASLLRDPHTVLCYTLNSRGGFTPHDAEEYIIDTRYPGYLLSSESKEVTMEQVKRDSPNFVSGEGWVPPSAYASIREQRKNRNISRTSSNLFGENFQQAKKSRDEYNQLKAQKKVVVLMNEGTASAAEVFASAIHDNARTVATVGTKTYGKGLIQHTFPLQDGGGLRLSVAEYLTPALQHVTKVGGARYDPSTGDYIGGGIKPDIFCPSIQGIPSNIGADICVGMALDALDDADARELQVAASLDNNQSIVGRRGGSDGAGAKRRTLTQGIVKDDF